MRWTDALPRSARLAPSLILLSLLACADDGKGEDGANDSTGTVGDGDGDPGDGDPGDGDPGDGDPGDGDPGDGDPGDGDPGDGDPGDGDGDGIMCPDVFPTFDKSCGGDDECAIAIHTTDCCGNSVALGINMAELADFEAAEAICDSQYPPCGCPAGPTVAEDGQAVLDPRALVVSCDDGSCMTSVQ